MHVTRDLFSILRVIILPTVVVGRNEKIDKKFVDARGPKVFPIYSKNTH